MSHLYHWITRHFAAKMSIVQPRSVTKSFSCDNHTWWPTVHWWLMFFCNWVWVTARSQSWCKLAQKTPFWNLHEYHSIAILSDLWQKLLSFPVIWWRGNMDFLYSPNFQLISNSTKELSNIGNKIFNHLQKLISFRI